MNQSVLESVRAWLTQENISFREVHHEPTYTSEESARARGEDLSTGAKALLMKADTTFHLFVLSAALKVNSGAIKQRLGVKKLRFADVQELSNLTGLVPGSVPPFGRPILPFDLFVDVSIQQQERIAFNAGSLTDSIIMASADYLRITKPELLLFGVSP